MQVSTDAKTTGSPDVELAGYSIPHPSEPKMNMRIQTDGKSAEGFGKCTPRSNRLVDTKPLVTLSIS